MFEYYEYKGASGVISRGIVVNRTKSGLINVCKDRDAFNPDTELCNGARIVPVEPSERQTITLVDELPKDFSEGWYQLWLERLEWVGE